MLVANPVVCQLYVQNSECMLQSIPVLALTIRCARRYCGVHTLRLLGEH
jgi:hypothetical protein